MSMMRAGEVLVNLPKIKNVGNVIINSIYNYSVFCSIIPKCVLASEGRRGGGQECAW